MSPRTARRFPVHVLGASMVAACIAGAASAAGDPCVGPPPPGAIAEAEPCPRPGELDVYNSGCDMDDLAFFEVACGQAIAGTFFTQAPIRDTDWFSLTTPSGPRPVAVTMRVKSDVDLQLFYFGNQSDCQFDFPEFDMAVACETRERTFVLAPGEESWWVVAVNAFDGFPCDDPVDGRRYVIEWTCVSVTPCPALGDLNGDTDVGFIDLLTLLRNFGECVGDCAAEGDLDGDQRVGFDDLLVLLANFGPCPE